MNRLPSLFSNWHNLTNIQGEFQNNKNSLQMRSRNHLVCFVSFCFRLACLQLRSIHLTGINCDIIWRRNRRLPKNPSSSGPLTDLPDYTFMDGRPTPLGVSNTKKRIVCMIN